MDTKRKDEEDFKAKVMANPEWKRGLRRRVGRHRGSHSKGAPRVKQQFYRGTDSQLVQHGRDDRGLCRRNQEAGRRAPAGLSRGAIGIAEHRLFSRAPIYPAMEIARMTGALEADVAELGADDPFLKIVLDGRSPKEAATALVNGTKLADPAFRKQLVEGGEAAVAASTDPMIVLQRKLDPLRRE
jgi:hypothetical protein